MPYNLCGNLPFDKIVHAQGVIPVAAKEEQSAIGSHCKQIRGHVQARMKWSCNTSRKPVEVGNTNHNPLAN